MSEQTKRAVRLSQLADTLRSGATVTPAWCAAKFGVSRRTALRDLLDMEELVPLVAAEKWRHGQGGLEWRMFRKEEV